MGAVGQGGVGEAKHADGPETGRDPAALLDDCICPACDVGKVGWLTNAKLSPAARAWITSFRLRGKGRPGLDLDAP